MDGGAGVTHAGKKAAKAAGGHRNDTAPGARIG
jgi:hypothetical protein